MASFAVKVLFLDIPSSKKIPLITQNEEGQCFTAYFFINSAPTRQAFAISFPTV